MLPFCYILIFITRVIGLGGIQIGPPITYNKALDIIRLDKSTENVFTFQYSDAIVIISAAFGLGVTTVENHSTDKKPFHNQHIHAITPTGNHGKCHIFFNNPLIK